MRYCSKITGIDRAHLQPLTAQTKLNLMVCNKITDIGWCISSPSPISLTKSNLTSCKEITNAGLAHLPTPD